MLFSPEKLREIAEQASALNEKRYIKVGSTMVKNQDYYNLSEKDKEELIEKSSENLFEHIDSKLDRLNVQYNTEVNPIRKQILLLKYDLMIESVGDLTDEDTDYINILKNKLIRLEKKLSILEKSENV
jgi:hypothetical protein